MAGRRALRTAQDLIAAGLAPAEARPALDEVAARYAVGISPAMAALIDPTDPEDPIARQFLPSAAELVASPGESADPTADAPYTPVEGVVHRHADRVLLKIVHVCPVYCRFCFRREKVGPEGDRPLTGSRLDAALAYIEAHPEIWEVILTGGDPFMLSVSRAREIARRLAAIPHVRIVRWHTRMPVADPARVTAAYARAIKAEGATTYVVLHANHPRELSDAARAALVRLSDQGIPLLSQTVLLRGVNDDAVTLEALMRAFVESRVKPYYLHHPDLAPGTAHLRIGIAEGQALVAGLRADASGLCQPVYVLDTPGGGGKAPLGPSYVTETAHGHRVRDLAGGVCDYPSTD